MYNIVHGVDDVFGVRFKMIALFCLFQATVSSWRRRIPDSQIFSKELFGCVECYNKSVYHSSFCRELFSSVECYKESVGHPNLKWNQSAIKITLLFVLCTIECTE